MGKKTDKETLIKRAQEALRLTVSALLKQGLEPHELLDMAREAIALYSNDEVEP